MGASDIPQVACHSASILSDLAARSSVLRSQHRLQSSERLILDGSDRECALPRSFGHILQHDGQSCLAAIHRLRTTSSNMTVLSTKPERKRRDRSVGKGAEQSKIGITLNAEVINHAQIVRQMPRPLHRLPERLDLGAKRQQHGTKGILLGECRLIKERLNRNAFAGKTSRKFPSLLNVIQSIGIIV